MEIMPGKKPVVSSWGMEATENIEHILNIIEKEFTDGMNPDTNGFEIYMDVRKPIKRKR